MKTIINKLSGVLLLTLALLVTSCGGENSKLITQIGVSKADFVGEVSVGQLINKSNIFKVLNKEQLDMLYNEAEMQGFSKTVRTLLDSKNGALDYNAKVYAVINLEDRKPKMVYYAAIKDLKKFEEAINETVTTAQDYVETSKRDINGYTAYTINNNAILLYNKERVICTINRTSDDEIKAILTPSTTLDKMPYASELGNDKNDFFAVGNLNAIKNSVLSKSQFAMMELTDFNNLPQELIEKTYITSTLNFVNSNIESHMSLIAEDAATQKALEKEYNYIGKLKNSLNNYISKRPLVVFVQNIKGNKAAEFLNKMLQQSDNITSEGDKEVVNSMLNIVKHINGDIAGSLDAVVQEGFLNFKAKYSILLEGKAKSVFEEFKNTLNLIKIPYTEISDNVLSLYLGRDLVYLGYNDKFAYITTNKDFTEDTEIISPNLSTARYAKNNIYGYGVIDLNEIFNLPIVQQGLIFIGEDGANFARHLDYFKFKIETTTSASFALTFKDIDMNSLEYITRAIAKSYGY